MPDGDGSFHESKLVLEGFNVNQGWQVAQHPRFAVDLNGDGKAGIIGFGNDTAPWVAVSKGDGTLQPPSFVRVDSR